MNTPRHARLNWKTLLWRVFTLVACVVFALSIANPFLHIGWYLPMAQYTTSVSFWSYKEHVFMHYGNPWQLDYTFADYWSTAQDWRSFQTWNTSWGWIWLGTLSFTMFELQLLSIAFAILTILKEKLSTALLSTLLAAATLSLMFTLYLGIQGFYLVNLEPGFWLTLTSTILFSANTTRLGTRRLRQRPTNTPQEAGAA